MSWQQHNSSSRGYGKSNYSSSSSSYDDHTAGPRQSARGWDSSSSRHQQQQQQYQNQHQNRRQEQHQYQQQQHPNRHGYQNSENGNSGSIYNHSRNSNSTYDNGHNQSYSWSAEPQEQPQRRPASPQEDWCTMQDLADMEARMLAAVNGLQSDQDAVLRSQSFDVSFVTSLLATLVATNDGQHDHPVKQEPGERHHATGHQPLDACISSSSVSTQIAQPILPRQLLDEQLRRYEETTLNNMLKYFSDELQKMHNVLRRVERTAAKNAAASVQLDHDARGDSAAGATATNAAGPSVKPDGGSSSSSNVGGDTQNVNSGSGGVGAPVAATAAATAGIVDEQTRAEIDRVANGMDSIALRLAKLEQDRGSVYLQSQQITQSLYSAATALGEIEKKWGDVSMKQTQLSERLAMFVDEGKRSDMNIARKFDELLEKQNRLSEEQDKGLQGLKGFVVEDLAKFETQMRTDMLARLEHYLSPDSEASGQQGPSSTSTLRQPGLLASASNRSTVPRQTAIPPSNTAPYTPASRQSAPERAMPPATATTGNGPRKQRTRNTNHSRSLVTAASGSQPAATSGSSSSSSAQQWSTAANKRPRTDS
ncbi:hypothetical protein RI367_007427 [Sorochytrium milnesiophthora]